MSTKTLSPHSLKLAAAAVAVHLRGGDVAGIDLATKAIEYEWMTVADRGFAETCVRVAAIRAGGEDDPLLRYRPDIELATKAVEDNWQSITDIARHIDAGRADVELVRRWCRDIRRFGQSSAGVVSL